MGLFYIILVIIVISLAIGGIITIKEKTSKPTQKLTDSPSSLFQSREKDEEII